MATTTVKDTTTTTTTTHPPPQIINLNHFTQPQLQTLSTPTIPPDVVVPASVSPINPSSINLSTSSHRQTYTHLPQRHRFKPHLHLSSNSTLTPDSVTHSILHYLTHFLTTNTTHNPPPPPPFNIEKSKKLGRVNGKGEVVDFEELEERGDGVVSEELRRRVGGGESDEGVLRFLEEVEGEWGSRRKRRKYVDAGGFGDGLLLPVGWRLLLALKRRGSSVSVYCRRVVSPTGEHFMSCKEVASFLKSYFGDTDVGQERDQKTNSIQQSYVGSSAMNDSPAEISDLVAFDKAAHSTVAISASNARVTDDILAGLDNLPEVKVRDSFECITCNLTFEEKDGYLQHLLAYHRKTTKRFKLRTHVGEGVIIKDGKFECQFCHKVFEEKRRYNGHVGNHVRNVGKISNDLSTSVTSNKDPEPPLQETLPSITTKMDVQSSIVETSDVGNGDHAFSNQNANASKLEEPKIDFINIDAPLSSDSVAVQTGEFKLSSDAIAVQTEELNLSSVPIEAQTEDCNATKSPSEHFNHVSHPVTENNDMVSNDYGWDININSNCLADRMDASTSEIESYGSRNLGMGIGTNDHLEDTPGLKFGDMVFQDGVSTVPLTQSFDFFPSFDSSSNKAEHDFSVVDQKLENVTGFEELRFDDIEPFKYGYMNEMTGQDLPSLPGCSVNLGNDGRIEAHGFSSSVRFLSPGVMLNTVDASLLTVCVWCRTEFRLEGTELENPSDSIGYMCPTCKARVSGHFGGGGGGGLSVGPHGF